MKTFLIASIAGIILFAASASTSWYLINQQKIEEAANQPDDDVEGITPGSVADTKAQQATPPPALPETTEDVKTPDEKMPVALRPDIPITPEAILELSKSIQEKEQKLIHREKMLKQNENRANLLLADIDRERTELAAFEEKLDSKILLAQDMLEKLEIANDERQSQLQQISINTAPAADKSSDPAMPHPLQSKVDKVKDWFGGLKPEMAATYLETLANRGDLDLAARLLNTLEDRTKTKIMAAIVDKPFGADIFEAVMEVDGNKEQK